jgi:hypothetical protein
MIDGQQAIVTGLIGIDGVHGGYSEIHPVYAMAIMTSDTGSDQTWAFFIRNMGDEGECSSDIHAWPGLNGMYSIQLRVPTYANKVRLNEATTSINNVSWGAPPTGPSIAFDGAWTFLEFNIPVATIGTGDVVYGQIGLHDSFEGGGSAKRAEKRVVHAHREGGRKEAHDLDWQRIESRISNVAERRAFDADLRAIRVGPREQPRLMSMSFDHTIHIRPRSETRKAQRIHALRTTTATRTAYVKAIRALLLKYRPYFGPPTQPRRSVVRPMSNPSPHQ